MKKFLFTTLAVGALAVSAGAAVSATSAADMENLKNTDGCYQISTKENLLGFANLVNGGKGSICGVLTKDIVYNSDVVKDDKSGVKGSGYDQWVPIAQYDKGTLFTGTFDGQNHTIYGLYADNVAWEPALIGDAGAGAVIKNVNVRDSYFAPTGGGAAGILGALKAGSATIDNCSFDGLINGGKDNGGLVGSLKANTTLTLTDSYNTGKIGGTQDVGGLVGYLEAPSATLNMDNCYSTGSVSGGKALVGGSASSGLFSKTYATVDAENVGCLSSCTSDFLKNGVTAADSATLALNYLNNKSGASETKAEWDKLTNSEKAVRINNSVSGIEVDSVKTTSGKWITRTTIKTKVELRNVDTLLIKEDVVADSLVYDRQFEEGVASTIMVPFNYSVSASMKAKFYEFTDVVQDAEGAWKVNAKQVTVLKAHTPYLVMPTANGTLTFVGPFVLFANNNGAAYEVSIGSTAWKAVGVYTKKRWDTGVNENEIGTIYGFAAEAKSEKNPGDFVRGGKKVAILPLRSYLKYDASADNETVVSTPALTKMRAISSTEVASIDALPQSLSVELEDAPERVEIIESIEDPEITEGEETQDGEDLGEKPQGVAQSLMIRPDAQKADRWFNINGRNMKNKPKSQGAFIKNATPVIVK